MVQQWQWTIAGFNFSNNYIIIIIVFITIIVFIIIIIAFILDDFKDHWCDNGWATN